MTTITALEYYTRHKARKKKSAKKPHMYADL